MLSRHVTIACARCGRAAAEIALLPAQTTGEGQWHDRDRLERTEFMGTLVKFDRLAALQVFFEHVAGGDFAGARDLDFDFVAFVCRACNRAYCNRCWDIGAPVFDEGFYDYTSAVCPAGHEQIVDD